MGSCNPVLETAPPNMETRESNVCAVVITYFPQGDLLLRLSLVKPQVNFLVVIDNGTVGPAADRLRDIESELNVAVIRNTRNLGMAAALNQGAQWAEEHDCAWMLTLDQDTIVCTDAVRELWRAYERFPERKKVALVASDYVDPIRKTQSTVSDQDSTSWREVKTAITSGSLVSLSTFRLIGPFREEFFIDCVDFEYCLRARSMGFHVLMAGKPLMQHSIGAATRHRLPWKITATSNHSPTRRYYMTRNQILLARGYFWSEPKWIISMLYRHLKETILLCLFEKDIASKLKSIVVGAWDGLSSNLHRRPS